MKGWYAIILGGVLIVAFSSINKLSSIEAKSGYLLNNYEIILPYSENETIRKGAVGITFQSIPQNDYKVDVSIDFNHDDQYSPDETVIQDEEIHKNIEDTFRFAFSIPENQHISGEENLKTRITISTIWPVFEKEEVLKPRIIRFGQSTSPKTEGFAGVAEVTESSRGTISIPLTGYPDTKQISTGCAITAISNNLFLLQKSQTNRSAIIQDIDSIIEEIQERLEWKEGVGVPFNDVKPLIEEYCEDYGLKVRVEQISTKEHQVDFHDIIGVLSHNGLIELGLEIKKEDIYIGAHLVTVAAAVDKTNKHVIYIYDPAGEEGLDVYHVNNKGELESYLYTDQGNRVLIGPAWAQYPM